MVRLLRGQGQDARVGQRSFNPTMVRLLPQDAGRCFPPSYVSIPQWCDCCEFVEVRDRLVVGGFNPTMVRLLRWVMTEPTYYSLGFNPTMVRLLPLHYQVLCLRCSQFQSHNGAIAATLPAAFASLSACFNPTMVRLLRRLISRILQLQRLFQSHNGAIAAW